MARWPRKEEVPAELHNRRCENKIHECYKAMGIKSFLVRAPQRYFEWASGISVREWSGRKSTLHKLTHRDWFDRATTSRGSRSGDNKNKHGYRRATNRPRRILEDVLVDTLELGWRNRVDGEGLKDEFVRNICGPFQAARTILKEPRRDVGDAEEGVSERTKERLGQRGFLAGAML